MKTNPYLYANPLNVVQRLCHASTDSLWIHANKNSLAWGRPPESDPSLSFSVSIMADPRLARAVDPRRISTPTQPPPPPPTIYPQQQAGGGFDGAHEGEVSGLPQQGKGSFKLRFCTVCASNQNRYVLIFTMRAARTQQNVHIIFNLAIT